jgi:D-serine deaminase-like pyridoxal phosphate-dependent protein
MTENSWYTISDINKLDSPALVFYPERIKENIRVLTGMIDDVNRLRPHVKTHKTREATQLMMEAGIKKFKCATIAEAEMLGMIKAPDVLLAYQPGGPKIDRFTQLIKRYPDTKFSCLVDNPASSKAISAAAVKSSIIIPVYLDLNVGMNRTGIITGDAALQLYIDCTILAGINPVGLHAYDGHIHDADYEVRTQKVDEYYGKVVELQKQILQKGYPEPIIVAGGTPTFQIHAKRKVIECSPGTFILWDKGYQDAFTEQKFHTSALLAVRVISMPDKTKICVDLGHKAVAAENDLQHRAVFLNAPDLKVSGQSEEHLVLEAGEGHSYQIGDVLYGLPVHICPTCALHERATTIEDNKISGEWKIISRDRKITI